MTQKALSTTELAKRIEEITGVKPNLIKNVLKAIVEVAEDEISEGRPFQIQGLVKLTHGYKPALKKGRLVRDPSTGETKKADSARPAQITVKARALAAVKKAVPSPTSKAGKPIADAGKARAEAAAARKAQREAEAA